VNWCPEGPLTLIAGTPAGGGQDRPARALAAALAEDSGEPAISVTNIPGRGGSNGWDRLLCESGNPQMIAISGPTLITNRLTGVSDYDHQSFTPLVNLYTEYIAFVVAQTSPLTQAEDWLVRQKADPGTCRIALATALGNTNHLALAMVAHHGGIDPRSLAVTAHDSALFAVDAVIDGDADIAAVTAVSAAKAMASGRLRALAVSSPAAMSGAYSHVPTWVSLDVNCCIGTWRGVIAPPAIPPDARAYWCERLRDAVRQPVWQDMLAAQYWSSSWIEGDTLSAFLDEEARSLRTALHNLGIIS